MAVNIDRHENLPAAKTKTSPGNFKRSDVAMPNRRPIMSDKLKLELAEELGIGDIVRKEGFGPVSSRNCGNLVKKAIERAERLLEEQ